MPGWPTLREVMRGGLDRSDAATFKEKEYSWTADRILQS